jgi:hypothetical protein
MPDHNPDKPEPKRNWLVREITNYKIQITNKYTAAFLSFKKLREIFLSVNGLY